MRFEVRNSNDEVVGAYDFEIDYNQERKINMSSSTGGTVHAFMDSSPFIYVRLPSYVVEAGSIEVASEEAPPQELEPAPEPEPETTSAFSS